MYNRKYMPYIESTNLRPNPGTLLSGWPSRSACERVSSWLACTEIPMDIANQFQMQRNKRLQSELCDYMLFDV